MCTAEERLQLKTALIEFPIRQWPNLHLNMLKKSGAPGPTDVTCGSDGKCSTRNFDKAVISQTSNESGEMFHELELVPAK